MKERYFTAAAPAVLVAMGVMLSWTNLRFPGTLPTGIKLFFLFLLILLWLIQIVIERFSSRPFIEHKLGMFSTGVATAFYGLSAIESFRLFRVHHQPAEDWMVLALSMLIALAVIAVCIIGKNNEFKEKNCETDRT